MDLSLILFCVSMPNLEPNSCQLQVVYTETAVRGVEVNKEENGKLMNKRST